MMTATNEGLFDSLMDMSDYAFLCVYGDESNDGEVCDICQECLRNGNCYAIPDDFGYDDKGKPIVVECNSYME